MPCNHPYIHAGAGRTDRLLKALIPSNVVIDDRDIADLMVLTARFGKVVNYWNTDNKPDGDWSCFWESDYLFFLATVAAAHTEGVENEFKKLEKKLLDNQANAPSFESRRNDTQTLISMIFGVAVDIAKWGRQSDVFPSMQQDIAAIIRSNLRTPLRDLMAYDKGLPKDNDFSDFIYDCNTHPLTKEWQVSLFDFEQNIDFIDPTIDYLASWQALKKIFRRFIRAHERIRKQAATYLKSTPNDPNRRQHPPHIVLFMSFLHLFRHLQDQLNALPEKHLDYYYNDILHLQQRGEVPDHAHLVFQLALNVYQQTLPAGTLFRAGKTPDGKDMFYTLERPLTLNQAQVVALKTLLIEPNTEGGAAAKVAWEYTALDTDKDTEAPDKIKDVVPFRPLGQAGEGSKKSEVGFAISSAVLPKSKSHRTLSFDFGIKNSGIINTQGSNTQAVFDLLKDNLKIGITAKATEKPFDIKDKIIIQKPPLTGNLITVSGTVIDGNTNDALVGVTVVVKGAAQGTTTDIEGKFILFNCPNNATLTFGIAGFNQKEIQVNGRTNLGIIIIGGVIVGGVRGLIGGTELNSFQIKATIPKNELSFDSPNKAKGDNLIFKANEPVLKVSLDEKSKKYQEVYDLLSSSDLEYVYANIDVKNLTDFDIYEGSFNRPLGHTINVDLTSAARQGGLLVRCDEAFRKGIQALVFKLDKVTDAVIINAALVINGQRRFEALTGATTSTSKFNIDTNKGELAAFTNIQDILTDDEKKQAQLDAYINIELQYTRPTVKDKVQEFDSPVFANTSIDYIINRPLDDTEFFHLSSHGGHAAVSPNGSTFFPPFPNLPPLYKPITTDNESMERGEGNYSISRGITNDPAPLSTPSLYRGNLFIGIKNIPKLGIVSLLFQMADGTEVDRASFPPDIDWSYLTGNKWQRFPAANIVFDSTKADPLSKRSLVQSGIIEFQMPADIKKGDTLLNPAYYWIRASALETAKTTVGALPSLIGVHAQAGRVRLTNSPIGDSHFDSPLPPSTISQLKFRQAAVRLIEQPYEGFGGRANEHGAAYHLRISERLRHKKRAITAWDYEHLVLEQFPEVRFVKCVNHYFPNDDEAAQTLITGAATVVVLPLKTQNPLQPQANRSTLESIKAYLKKHCNGFTADKMLEVVSPHYQSVVVSLRVKFHTGDIEKYVHNLDNDIARFIAPWAFDNQIEPSFGKSLYKTELLSQIEALDYVDYIEDLYITDLEAAGNVTIPDRLDAQKNVVTRKILVIDKNKVFVAPKNALTLLTSHQLTQQTPFETNHSITPIF